MAPASSSGVVAVVCLNDQNEALAIVKTGESAVVFIPGLKMDSVPFSSGAAAAAPCELERHVAILYVSARFTQSRLIYGTAAQGKQLLRTLVGEVKLPQDLEVSISRLLPEAIMNGLVAGDSNSPNVLILRFRLALG